MISKAMKTFVLTVSERFPKSHPKAGQPTNFPMAIKHMDKIHTIRSNYLLWESRFRDINSGEACLSVRKWGGQPYRSKQLEIFRYDNTRGIGIEKLTEPDNFLCAKISGVDVSWETVAKNDGLDFFDFCDWFNVRQREPMAVIHFTDFRYSTKTNDQI